MATYTEIRGLFNNDDLRNRVEVALIIAASSIIGGTPTSEEQEWAARCFASPRIEAEKALMAVLAENSSETLTVIENASDAAIQTNVDAVVPTLVVARNIGG